MSAGAPPPRPSVPPGTSAALISALTFAACLASAFLAARQLAPLVCTDRAAMPPPGGPSFPFIPTASLPPVGKTVRRQLAKAERGVPDSSFYYVPCSAYRVNKTRIVVLGVGSAHTPRHWVKACAWISSTGQETEGTVSIIPSGAIVTFCDFPGSKGGGSLAAEPGGLLLVGHKGHTYHPFNETGTPQASTPSGNVAYCGAPFHHRIESRAVLQWVQYHLYHAHYHHLFLYDGGGDTQQLKAQLQPLLDTSIASLVDFKREASLPGWYHNQELAMNDCLYRCRGSFDWVSFHDYDEYLFIAPPHTLPSLLALHSSSSYFTHGAYDFDTTGCGRAGAVGTDSAAAGGAGGEGQGGGDALGGREGGGDGRRGGVGGMGLVWDSPDGSWAVEQLPFRTPHPFCKGRRKVLYPVTTLCLGPTGYRKLLANTRLVHHVSGHNVDYPASAGINATTDVIFHAHFRQLALPGYAVCKARAPGFNFTDFRVSQVAAQARAWAEQQEWAHGRGLSRRQA